MRYIPIRVLSSMKYFHRFWWIAAVAALAVSCGRKEARGRLIFSSASYSASISCIASSGSGHTFYLGLENGNIMSVNMLTREQEIIHEGYSRVYDLYEENDSVMWIGLRNQGLRMLTRDASNRWMEAKSYRIPVPDSLLDDDNYAVYDIEPDRSRGDLYLSTSSGAYLLSKEGRAGSHMEEFYRPKNFPRRHFGVNRTLVARDSVYMATQDGLAIFHKNGGGRVIPVASGITCLHKPEAENVVFASFASGVYVVNLETGAIDNPAQYRVKGNNLLACIKDDLEGVWKFTTSSIGYDNNGSIGFELPERLTDNCKNFVMPVKDFILLACGNTLYLLSKHQNTRGDSQNVIAACPNTKAGAVYFITNDNRLHQIGVGKDESQHLGKIRKFDSGERIARICATEAFLWAITDKRLYRIGIHKNPRAHLIIGEKGSGAPVETEEKLDFRSIAYCNNALYIGTRYHTMKIADPDLYKGDSNPDTLFVKRSDRVDDSNLYVTDICKDSENNIYFSTLNKGIFVIDNNKDSLIRIPGTQAGKIGSVRKMIHWSGKAVYLQSSKGIYVSADKKIADSLMNFPAKYVVSIQADSKSGKLFMLGYHGIGSGSVPSKSDTAAFRMDNEISSLDIVFNSAAAISEGEEKQSLLLGAPSGLYRYKINAGKGALTKIIIPHHSRAPLVILLIAVGLIATGGFAGYLRVVARRNTLAEFRARVNELTEKIVPKNIRKENRGSFLRTGNNLFGEIEKCGKRRKLLFGSLAGLRARVDTFAREVKEGMIRTQEVVDMNFTLIDVAVKDISKYEKMFASHPELAAKWESVKQENDREAHSVTTSYAVMDKITRLNSFLKGRMYPYYKEGGLNEQMQGMLDEIDRMSRDGGDAKKLKELSEEFWRLCPDLSDFMLWSRSKKIIACLYLRHEAIKPIDISACLDIEAKTISDIRAEINRDMTRIEHRTPLQELLRERTLSSRLKRA